MPAPPVERLKVEAAQLFVATEKSEDWMRLEQSYDRNANTNVVNLVFNGEGITCEQHNNDDTINRVSGKGALDLLTWQAMFENGSIEEIRIKEVDMASSDSSLKRKIHIESTCSSSPHCSSKAEREGTDKLEQKGAKGKAQKEKGDAEPSKNDEANMEGEEKAEGYPKASLSKHSESRCDRAEDFPLAALSSRSPPLRIRLQFNRVHQGRRRTWKVWNWSCFFAFLAGRLTYVSTFSKRENDGLASVNLPEWLEK